MKAYRIEDLIGFVELPDGSLRVVPRDTVPAADRVLRDRIGWICVDGRVGHANARFVGSCRVECPDCGSWFESSIPLSY